LYPTSPVLKFNVVQRGIQGALVEHTEVAVAVATRGRGRSLAIEVEEGLFEGDTLGELGNEVAMGATEDVALFETPGDCCWCNRSPDWGVEDSGDDPVGTGLGQEVQRHDA